MVSFHSFFLIKKNPDGGRVSKQSKMDMWKNGEIWYIGGINQYENTYKKAMEKYGWMVQETPTQWD